MAQALLVAAAARDLKAEFPHVSALVKIPGAAAAGFQLWHTNDRAFFVTLADPAITILTSRRLVALALRRFTWMVRCYTSAAKAPEGAAWKRANTITASDFIEVTPAGGGDPVMKQVSALVAGDVPTEYQPAHVFMGVPDTLGSPDT